jgi:taurine dioxygenase
LSRDESDALLDELWSFIDSPQFIYEHRWRVGDLVVWDNRSTMHRRDPFDSASRRVMHRTQIKGKLPPRAYASASGGGAAAVA